MAWSRRPRGSDADQTTSERLAAVDEQLARIEALLSEEVARNAQRERDLHDVLFAIRAREAENRERLFRLRATAEYAAVYEDPDPLVSILVPTYDRVSSLLERSLPSLLGQSHANIEILVVGDGSPPHVAEAINGLDDPRVRYVHLDVRGPYPDDPGRAWFVKGTPGINAGLLTARGQWICFFSDDDLLRPDAITTVLGEVRRGRHELCYGNIKWHRWDGTTQVVGEFPPRLSGQGLQGALLHAGLAFIQQDLSDSALRIPNDWSMTVRLLRMGVRVGYVDQVLADWHQAAHPYDGGADDGDDATA